MKTNHSLLALFLAGACALSSAASAQYIGSHKAPEKAHAAAGHQDFSTAMDHVMAGDFGQALPLLERAATGGDRMAQLVCGMLHKRGYGTPKNASRAFQLLQQATRGKASFPEALAELAECYRFGLGVDQDFAKSLALLKQGARAGSGVAMLEVGIAYFLGRGVEKDLPSAFAWFGLAADQRQPYATGNVAGVAKMMNEQQREHGTQLLEQLRKQRKAFAGDTLQFQFDMRSAESAAMKKGEKAYIARKLDEARRRLEPLARRHNAMALFYVARMHETGRGYEQDHLEAARLYALAVEKGDATSMSNLARLFAHGLGVKENTQLAVRLYEGAAWRGHAHAQNELGFRYVQGRDVERNVMRAFVWWTVAADAGHERARQNLEILLRKDFQKDKLAEGKQFVAKVREQLKKRLSPDAPKLSLGKPRLLTSSRDAVVEEPNKQDNGSTERDYRGSAQPERNTESHNVVMERFVSKDGKIELQKPRGWKVDSGSIFGKGTYGISVDNKDETAGIMLVAIPGGGPHFKDSDALADAMLGGMRQEFDGFQVKNRKADETRTRTVAEVTFMQDGKRYIAELEFVHGPNTAQMLGIGAKVDLWKDAEATLRQIKATVKLGATKVRRT